MPGRLKPCLVLGTGFHSWVLGDRVAKSAIGNWDVLLSEVARHMKVAWSPISGVSLSLLWEKMLNTAAQDGYFRKIKQEWRWAAAGSRKAYEIELDAKAIVALVLSQSMVGYPKCSKRASFPLQDQWGAILSLNFETAWLHGSNGMDTRAVGSAALRGMLKTGRKRMAAFTLVKNKRIWFPNGLIDDHATLRLGLRDFGLQPAEIQFGFNLLKQFERQNLLKPKSSGAAINWVESYGVIKGYLDIEHERIDGQGHQLASPPLAWVADFIYRPLIFAGVGLSQDELGLWWLLNQRQRNFAHLRAEHTPPAYILLRKDDRRMSFWQSRPFGLEPLVCSDWDEGWQMVDRLGVDLGKA